MICEGGEDVGNLGSSTRRDDEVAYNDGQHCERLDHIQRKLLTRSDGRLFAGAKVLVADQDGVVGAFFQIGDFVSELDIDTVGLDLRSRPRKVVRVLLTRGDSGATVNEGEEATFAVQIREEGILRSRVSEGREILHEAVWTRHQHGEQHE